MQDFEIRLPKLGESIVRATIVTIYKKEGDFVKKDETLMEVSTDKVNSEIPSPYEGKIKKIFVKENQDVEVNQVICTIETSQNAPKKSIVQKDLSQEIDEDRSNILSPAVLKLAAANNISIDELKAIKGTKEGG